MKKGLSTLFAILAGVVLALTVGSLGNGAKADDDHVHCACGAVHKAAADIHHTVDDEDAADYGIMLWEPATELPAPVEDGEDYVYLTEDIELSALYIMAPGQTLYICLNGHTISYSSKLFNVTGNSDYSNGAHLVITDCQGTGSLVTTGSVAVTGALALVHFNSTLDLFAGTLKGGDTTGIGGAVGLYNGTFNMFGGKLEY